MLKNKKPHNPLQLTGGLTLASLLKPDLCFSERFEYFLKKCVQLVGISGNILTECSIKL